MTTSFETPKQKAAGAVADLADEAAAKVDEIGAARSGQTADATKAAAFDLKNAAMEQGRQLYEVAKTEATSFADQRKGEAADSISGVASALRDAGGNFGERPNIQAFVSNAADGLDQLAGGLRDRSFADLYADVESYARRSPVVVGAATLAAGFLLARFIKATSDDLAESAEVGRRTSRLAAARAAHSTGDI